MLGELDESGKKEPISSYKINTGEVTYNMMNIVNNTLWFTGKLLRQ